VRVVGVGGEVEPGGPRESAMEQRFPLAWADVVFLVHKPVCEWTGGGVPDADAKKCAAVVGVLGAASSSCRVLGPRCKGRRGVSPCATQAGVVGSGVPLWGGGGGGERGGCAEGWWLNGGRHEVGEVPERRWRVSSRNAAIGGAQCQAPKAKGRGGGGPFRRLDSGARGGPWGCGGRVVPLWVLFGVRPRR